MARRPSSRVAVRSFTRNAIPAAQTWSSGALIAERRAELETLAQAGAGLFGVGLGDGHADGEQAAGDERRIADLPGQRERLAGQRDRPGRVADKQVTARGEAELEGGVGEVATGPRKAAACSARRAASANAPAVNAMFERASQMTSSTRQSWGSRRSLASAARRHSSSVTVTSAAMGREPGADRQGERVARVRGRAGQLQGRLAVQQQGLPGRDLARREAGQDRKRGVNIAGVDRPGPGSEQVVLFGAEPHRPKHLLAPVVMPDLL